MPLNWQNLRPWNGSQQNAFEELCCQLAHCEPVPPGSRFVRKRPPDAGVECFWTLPKGDEWAWQAKFFTSSPDDGRWRQLDESVDRALEKHPRLTVYTVCLPIDREDPRIEQQRWFMDRWNERVDRWKARSQEKGMAVEFTYWGEHDLWLRLTREEHAGRRHFWFNEEELSRAWFENRLEETIANAEPRYTPELRVELPIAKVFDGLGRTPDFHDRLRNRYGRLKRAYAKAAPRQAVGNAITRAYDSLAGPLERLQSLLGGVQVVDDHHVDLEAIQRLSHEGAKAAIECASVLREAAEHERATPPPPDKQPARHDEHSWAFERHYLLSLMTELQDLAEFSTTPEACSANARALLVVGEAGTGKTHLFCDVARQRIQASLPTIVLLGEHFLSDADPWSQILSNLQLSCANRQEFLGALDAAAEASDTRALIMIDALNEGGGPGLWRRHLGGMLAVISRYPRVCVALSVRSSYERATIPNGLVPDRLPTVVHHGFAGHEYEAMRAYFGHFGIALPSVPLLLPEFQNPLFLKILCRGLRNKRMTRIPDGLEGITTVFDFFIDSINEKLSLPEYLGFGVGTSFVPPVVRDAVRTLAKLMAEWEPDWLPRADAESTVISLRAAQGDGDSLFRHLISEGLLAEDMFPSPADNEWTQGVRFAYQRFADHIIALYLLDEHLDIESPATSFEPEQPLGTLFKDEWDTWRRSGLLEALCIQIPERTGKELVELAPSLGSFLGVQEAFVNSLIWRDPEAVGDGALSFINDRIIKSDETHDKLQDAFLTVATNPRHPFNADFLHRSLMQRPLPERDETWSVWLHYQYGTQGAVDRLIDWAWSPADKSHVDDEAVRLCGVALAWFLTSSNRFLRDRATKALVSLFTDRLHVLRKLIPEFLSVDDPYVPERLFAVAYGCVLRTRDHAAIIALAKDTYDWVFRDGKPPVHILLRDYARGVIETACRFDDDLGVDIDKVRPPYSSEWPNSIPAEEELRRYGQLPDSMPDEELGRIHLYGSVMASGDFAQYVIGTGWAGLHWSSRRLSEPGPPSRKEQYRRFLDSLTPRQKRAWDRHDAARSVVALHRLNQLIGQGTGLEDSDPESTAEEPSVALTRAEAKLRESLGRRKSRVFDEVVLPYLADPRPQDHFDPSIAPRWVFQRVLDLGWTVERFGHFDRSVKRWDRRDAHKPERIGKKYQWIAYHEFLARLADNFELRKGYRDDEPEPYEGPWQIGTRDIDPSCLLKSKQEQRDKNEGCWWSQAYASWDSELDDATWLRRDEDRPDVRRLIQAERPSDRSKWLTLQAVYTWEQPAPPEEERFEKPRRNIWYHLRSYIVRTEQSDQLFQWLQSESLQDGWRTPRLHDVFLGEYPWAPAFVYHDNPYYGRAGWARPSGEMPAEAPATGDEYFVEGGGFDCSVDDGFSIYLPAKWIVNNMILAWNGTEGHFFHKSGELAAFDPSVREAGPGALLVRQDTLLEFLSDGGYDILWTLHGEKIVLATVRFDSPGHLEIRGAFRIKEGQAEGVLRSNFVSRA